MFVLQVMLNLYVTCILMLPQQNSNLILRELRSWALKMAAVIVWPTALKRRLLAGRSSSSIYPGPLLPFAVFPLPFFFLPSIVSLLAEAMENAAISLFRDAHVLNPPALISVLLARVDSSAALQELSVLQTKTRSTYRVVLTMRRKNTFQRSSGVNSQRFPRMCYKPPDRCRLYSGKLVWNGDFLYNHRTAPTTGPLLFLLSSMLHKTVK